MSTPSLFQPIRPPRTSLMYTLPIRRLRDILGHAVPGVTLISVEEIPSTRLPRLYNLNLSDGKQLLLSFAPSLAVRLLRNEQTLLSSEATLIHFLSCIIKSSLKKSPPSPESITGPQASRATHLSHLVPVMVKHSSNPREMGYPYTLFEPGVGEPLSDLSIYLSRPEQRLVDKQIGSFVRNLALITSPSGNFGTVSRVCNDPSIPVATASSSAPRGSPNWTGAFMSLMEGILRDGEDMSVLLPYEVIRKHFDRLSWRLSAVTVPRLVIIDAGDPTNVLIQRNPEGGAEQSVPEGPQVTGLRDWSQGIFGDPLLSSCFEGSSEGFLEGWRLDGTEDIIEDEEGAAKRLLLYRCYRAIVSIVTEYYRPQADSSRRELEGRRKLTIVLAELEKADVEQIDFVKRARSASGSAGEEASKRQKLEPVHT